MTFVRYTGGRTHADPPQVSIHPSGKISFNVSACIRFQIREFSYAALYFDTEAARIGIDFLKTSEKGAVAITKLKGGRTAYISAKSFLVCYDVPLRLTHYRLRKRHKDRFCTFRVRRAGLFKSVL